MKKQISAAVCAIILLLSGCSSAESSSSQGSQGESIVYVDVGGNSIGEDKAEGGSGSFTHTTASIRTTAEFTLTETAEPTEEISLPEQTGEPINTTQSTSASSTPITTEQSTTQTTTKSTTQTTETTTETTTAQTTENEPIEIEPQIGTNSYMALNYPEVKAVWISYIELAELLQGRSASEFRANIGVAFDNCTLLGLNTVYIHARSHGDAYYESQLFPWSKYVTGALNQDPGFDPLQIIIEEAHARGISLHAWINPLRTCGVSQLDSYGDFPVRQWAVADGTAGNYVVDVGGTYYLNPAYEAVVDLIAQGAAEIAANYDVDGIHIDDYFYPTTDASFDSAAFSSSGYDTISAFRFANCDKLVSEIYSAVKAANSTALFGVSCQGSVDNNYNLMYADVKKWCRNSGYLDYIAPQIYYGFNNSTQPYEQCLAQWNEIAGNGGVPLIAGLSVSKVGLEDKWAGSGKNEWIDDKEIISRQIICATECTAYGGTALYSYRSIFLPESGVKSQVDEEMASVKRLLTN